VFEDLILFDIVRMFERLLLHVVPEVPKGSRLFHNPKKPGIINITEYPDCNLKFLYLWYYG
jgi:hypothetical protein